MKCQWGRRRRLLKCFALMFLLYMVLAIITHQFGIVLILRDLGYLTRPLWDRSRDIPEITIPHFHSDSLAYDELCGLHGWTKREEDDVPQVIDAVIFSVELDLLEIRLRELWDVVDIFVVLEADRTHNGKRKAMILNENIDKFSWAKKKLKTIALRDVLVEFPKKEFDNEVKMRDNMKKVINSLGLKTGDIVISADVDEIPYLHSIKLIKNCKGYPSEMHLQMQSYLYSFEFLVQFPHWRPHIRLFDADFLYHHGKDLSNHQLADAGWHCSFCFRYLSDFVFKMSSYSHSDRVTNSELLRKENIQKKICEGADVYDMLPEAYSFQELIANMGKIPHRMTAIGIPETVINNHNKYKFLLPGGCVREDAPDEFKVGNAAGNG